jgi:hypothetical protein
MVEPPSDLPNAHPIPMRDSDLTVLFHRQHPFFSVIQGPSSKSPQPTEITAVGPFSMPISSSRRGPLLHADFHARDEIDMDDVDSAAEYHGGRQGFALGTNGEAGSAAAPSVAFPAEQRVLES